MEDLVKFPGAAYYLDGLGASLPFHISPPPNSPVISDMPNFMRMCVPVTCSGSVISIGHGWVFPCSSSPGLARLLSFASDTRTSLGGVSLEGVPIRFVGGACVLTCGDGDDGGGALVLASASWLACASSRRCFSLSLIPSHVICPFLLSVLGPFLLFPEVWPVHASVFPVGLLPARDLDASPDVRRHVPFGVCPDDVSSPAIAHVTPSLSFPPSPFLAPVEGVVGAMLPLWLFFHAVLSYHALSLALFLSYAFPVTCVCLFSALPWPHMVFLFSIGFPCCFRRR